MLDALQSNETFRGLALRFQQHFNRDDPWAERVDASVVDAPWPPIFLLGPPRSGTTVLYQILLQQLQLAFIPNLLAAVPGHLVKICRLAPWLVRGLGGEVRSSYHGFVPGLRSPSEAGKIIDRWFGAEPSARDRASIRGHLAALSHAARSPVLLKALNLTPRLDALLAVFPRARFVRIRRDPRYVVQSVVEQREQLGLGVESWWSIEPPGWEEQLGRPVVEQAAWQVAALEGILDRTLAGRPVADLDYEELCVDPAGAVARVAAAFDLSPARHPPPVPERLDAANSRRVDDATWSAIERALGAEGLPFAGSAESSRSS